MLYLGPHVFVGPFPSELGILGLSNFFGCSSRLLRFQGLRSWSVRIPWVEVPGMLGAPASPSRSRSPHLHAILRSHVPHPPTHTHLARVQASSTSCRGGSSKGLKQKQGYGPATVSGCCKFETMPKQGTLMLTSGSSYRDSNNLRCIP